MGEVMMSSPRSADLAGVRPEALGAAIRALRGERGIRLADLAEQTSLSVSFLSQLERGLTNPSLPSLVKISAALGTSAHALLASLSPLPETPAYPASPASPAYQGGQDGAYIDNTAGYARSLVRGRRAIQPMEVVGAATIMRNWAVHDADEFMYLCDGEAEVELEGLGLFHLTRGATVYCDAGVRHRWRQVGTDTVRMLLVLSSPQQSRPLDVQLGPRVKA
jgi:transcriptional regulator with XRE-family HTH domain